MIDQDDTLAVNRTLAAAKNWCGMLTTPTLVNDLDAAISRVQGLLARLYAESILSGGFVVEHVDNYVIVREPGGHYVTIDRDAIGEDDIPLASVVEIPPVGRFLVTATLRPYERLAWFSTPNDSEY